MESKKIGDVVLEILGDALFESQDPKALQFELAKAARVVGYALSKYQMREEEMRELRVALADLRNKLVFETSPGDVFMRGGLVAMGEVLSAHDATTSAEDDKDTLALLVSSGVLVPRY